MLVLTFRVAGSDYAIAVARVAGVVPRVPLRALPQAPPHLVGLLRYRGGAVPVVDLGLLMGGAACGEQLDTRIILVDTGAEVGGLLGLAAERVDEVRTLDRSRGAVAGPEIGAARYLGDVYETDDGLLQLIEPGRVLVGLTPAAVGEGPG
jgi:chemotaxis-related protein WspB